MSGIKTFTRLTGDVANVSGLVRLKRLGKIRLGIKKMSTKTKREYPSETDHFVVPKEIADLYGPEPKELDAMFASNNPEEVYMEKLALYGASSGLKCHGDGKTAERRDEKGNWQPQTCPCEFLKTPANPTGQCGPQAHLMVMLPKVSMWGNYQITTRSIYARAGILSSLKNLQDMVGRIAYIPLKLSRIPQEINHDGKVKTHYIVGFTPDLGLPQIMDLRNKPELMMLPAQYELEPAVDQNPALDPVDVETDEEPEDEENDGIEAERLANMTNQELDAVQKALKEQQEKKVTPQQTTGAGASTRSDQATAVGTPVKSEAPAGEKKELAKIPKDEWESIVAEIDNTSELNALKKEWKADHHVTNITYLNAAGQHQLMQYIRENAAKIGVKVTF